MNSIMENFVVRKINGKLNKKQKQIFLYKIKKTEIPLLSYLSDVIHDIGVHFTSETKIHFF